MIGFVHNLNNTNTLSQHQVECFYAEKDTSQLYEDITRVQHKDDVHLNLAQKHSHSKQEDEYGSIKRRNKGKMNNQFYAHSPNPEKDEYISWVNQQDLSWKANPCMLTTSHPEYSQCEDYDDQEHNLALTESDNIRTNSSISMFETKHKKAHQHHHHHKYGNLTKDQIL